MHVKQLISVSDKIITQQMTAVIAVVHQFGNFFRAGLCIFIFFAWNIQH